MAETSIERELETIYRKNHKILRPMDVVEFAKNPDTALHSRFEWDNKKAAHAHRLQQAREIIRVHVRVIEEGREPVRAYVSLKSQRAEEGGGYHTIAEVLSDADMRAELLEQARADAEMFTRKYQSLKELAPVLKAMEEVFPAAKPDHVAAK